MFEDPVVSAKTLRNRKKKERKKMKKASMIQMGEDNCIVTNKKPASSKRSNGIPRKYLPKQSTDVENKFAYYSNNGQLDQQESVSKKNTKSKKRKHKQIHNGNGNLHPSNEDQLLSNGKSESLTPKRSLDQDSGATLHKAKRRKKDVASGPQRLSNGPHSSRLENAKHPRWEQGESFQELQLHRKNLPIHPLRKQLMALFAQEKCIIFKGETGCGKTTQIPQFILEGNINSNGMIAVTQPRRVAAISIAERVAAEVGTTVGDKVGYCVRFDDCTSDSTKIKYLTDGMLLRESIGDPLLMPYSWVILDEAHERTIHTDVLFGIVKSAQQKRSHQRMPPLKVIIMSATIDEEKMSNYFNDSSIYHIPGREYSIEVHNLNNIQDDYVAMALSTVFHIHQNRDKGDILVFLTGEEEIESTVEETKKLMLELTHPELKLCPRSLYAALPSDAQCSVLKPSLPTERKVIYSTNIAETSLTIPGIKYVVDTGMVKSKIFNSVSGLDLLKVQRISKAQADQRTGRAGRETTGSCYRLYTLEQFKTFLDFPIPEIQRCSLSSVLLQIIAIGVSDIQNFDFLDRPSDENIRCALEQLRMLQAIEGNDSNLVLTEMGKQMVNFPLDPRFSKMVITSAQHKCTDEILTIISLLSVESVFRNAIGENKDISGMKKRLGNNEGDHMMLLNVFKAFRSSSSKASWCSMNFVNYKNVVKAVAIRQQLSQICQKIGIANCSCGPDTSRIGKCLSTGLFMNAAHLYKNRIYKTIGSKEKVFIHPSSSLFRGQAFCCIYTDLIETSKCYMRNVSIVEEEWLLDAAPEYFKKHKLNRFQLMSV